MVKLPKDFLVSGALLSPRPGQFWLGGGEWKWEKLQPQGTPAFYAPDFFLSAETPWAIPSQWVEFSGDELRQALLHFEDHSADPTDGDGIFEWESPSPVKFEESFRELRDCLERGVLYKGVPVVFERARIGATSAGLDSNRLRRILLQLLDSLNEKGSLGKSHDHHLRLYGLWNPQGGILGATPEKLFELSAAGRLSTMALAGTRRRTESLEADRADLMSDAKERREHQWVIEDILEALSGDDSSRCGQVRVGETRVLELPTLLHLMTPIEVELRLDSYPEIAPSSLENWVRRLHPTAALGAFPRKPGWAWLKAQDQLQGRDRFGAPFAAVSPGKGSCCLVAIRNIQWGEEGVRVGAGCGVIKESQFEREWDELALKRNAVKRLMGL